MSPTVAVGSRDTLEHIITSAIRSRCDRWGYQDKKKEERVRESGVGKEEV